MTCITALLEPVMHLFRPSSELLSPAKYFEATSVLECPICIEHTVLDCDVDVHDSDVDKLHADVPAIT